MNSLPSDPEKSPFLQIETPESQSPLWAYLGAGLALAALGLRLALFLASWFGAK